MTNTLLVVCVYKTGGDFDGEYVEALYEKLSEYNFVCLTDASDVPEHITQVPLKFGWEGWWSKMELFDPLFAPTCDILYFDLDTVIVDNIDEMTDICVNDTMIMLSDFYYPKNLASGVMYIPYKIKNIFWNEFVLSPHGVMNNTKGDQDFLVDVIKRNEIYVDRWDKLLPDYIASYKAHITKQYPKQLRPLEVDVSKSKVIAFHGKPRPKDVNWKTL